MYANEQLQIQLKKRQRQRKINFAKQVCTMEALTLFFFFGSAHSHSTPLFCIVQNKRHCKRTHKHKNDNENDVF